MRTATLLAAGALVLAAVLAGCGTGGQTANPQATDTATPSALSQVAPPGVGQNGTNVSALAAAHETALEDRSFALDLSVEQGGSVERIEIRTTAGPTPTTVRAERPGWRRVEYFDDRWYRRTVENGTTSYGSGQYAGGRPDWTGRSMLVQYMGPATYRPDGVVTRSGRRLLVLDAVPGSLPADAFGSGRIVEFESRALVTTDGVVRSFSLTATGSGGGRLAVRLTVEGIGTTAVARPAWTAETTNATRR